MGMVYQRLMLVPNFIIAENVVLGVELGVKFWVSCKKVIHRTEQLIFESELNVDPKV